MIDILKALGDENRLRIMNLLMKTELCVCEIETILDMSQSNVSRHLKKLKDAHLIGSSKDAQWIHYKLCDVFASENESLISFLYSKMSTKDAFLKDLLRYQRYVDNNFSCTDIRADKERVLNLIR